MLQMRPGKLKMLLLLAIAVIRADDRQGGFVKDSRSYGLRCSAGSPLIIERQVLRSTKERRALVLWMCGAEKHEDEIVDDHYTCPDQTRGHFYRGQTWLSLIDEATGRIVNTISIRSDWENETTFDIPYRIGRYFYSVPSRLDTHGEGKPKILRLKDYNGDGDALEFVLFEAENCTIVKTSLFGYSRRKDRVMQYPIRLSQREGTKTEVRNSPWLDRFMLQKPVSPGHWEWKYQYHAGGLTHFDVRYNKSIEAFEGEITIDLEGARSRQ